VRQSQFVIAQELLVNTSALVLQSMLAKPLSGTFVHIAKQLSGAFGE